MMDVEESNRVFKALTMSNPGMSEASGIGATQHDRLIAVPPVDPVWRGKSLGHRRSSQPQLNQPSSTQPTHSTQLNSTQLNQPKPNQLKSTDPIQLNSTKFQSKTLQPFIFFKAMSGQGAIELLLGETWQELVRVMSFGR